MKKYQVRLNKYHLYWLSNIAEKYFTEYINVKNLPCLTQEEKELQSEFGVSLTDGRYQKLDLLERELCGFCKALQLDYSVTLSEIKISSFRTNKIVFWIKNLDSNQFSYSHDVEDYVMDLAQAGL